jgi:hypothetical protein
MPITESAYLIAPKNPELTWTPSGVLTLRFHASGGPATLSGRLL